MELTEREERILSLMGSVDECQFVNLHVVAGYVWVKKEHFLHFVECGISKDELEELYMFKLYWGPGYKRADRHFNDKHSKVCDICGKYKLNKEFFGIMPLGEYKEKTEASYGTQRSKTHGYVYFVKDKDGFTKIGKTKNISNRMRSYVTENAHALIFLNSISYENYNDAEKERHERYKEYRHRGEWFKLPDNEIEYIKSVNDNCLPK